jgi:N utilization substance protein B
VTDGEPRDRALQILYEAERRGFEEPDLGPLTGKAARIVDGVTEHLAEIDATINRLSAHWRTDRMPVVDLTVLRMGVYELRWEDTPPGVVLAEAARLASAYSTEKSAPFVNGVLSAVAAEQEPGSNDRGSTYA